jgi:hypothetical protein
MMFKKGMASFSGLPHGEFVWYLRLQPEIQQVYKQLYDTEELLTNFCGLSVFFSTAQKSDPWWHADQNPKNPTYSVQGAYNLLPVGEHSAGFVVVPGSHRNYVPEAARKGGRPDWILLKQDEEVLRGGVKLVIPANCMVLWNSRSLHANVGPTKVTPGVLDRLTAYITFAPRWWRKSDAVFEERKAAYLEAKGCSHWVDKCEVKKYPWGFGPLYERRGFIPLKAVVDKDGNIPPERLAFI